MNEFLTGKYIRIYGCIYTMYFFIMYYAFFKLSHFLLHMMYFEQDGENNLIRNQRKHNVHTQTSGRKNPVKKQPEHTNEVRVLRSK